MKRNGRKSLAGALARAKNESGFTLVELIVVIAILGILAGVGTVGYSGYIKKANMAADEILLDSLNTAFAAACIENGEDATEVDANDITISGGTVSKTNIVVTDPGEKATAIQEDFASYYEGGTFKVITALKYNQSKGMFEDANGGETYTYNFAGSTVTISAADKAILSGDNAFKNRGSAALLDDVGALETYLAGGFIGAEILEEVGKSDEFFSAVGSYLGLSTEDYADFGAYKEAVGEKLTTLENENAVNNALIMYAASNAANVTSEQIADLFTGTVTSNIEVKNDGVRDNAATMANAALAYGMYTAYVQQYPDAENADNFIEAVNSESFKKYYSSDQGKTDLEAYIAAMNMISDNTGNSAITSSILENGINGNDDLAKLMKDIMGN